MTDSKFCLDVQVMVAEVEAMEYCGVERLVGLEDIRDRLLRIRRGVLPTIMDPDNESRIEEWMGITAPISVDAAEAIMSAFEERVGGYHYAMLISVQKWCAAYCFAPWLLDKDRFGVGLCYYGNYGDAPTRVAHCQRLVNEKPRSLKGARHGGSLIST